TTLQVVFLEVRMRKHRYLAWLAFALIVALPLGLTKASAQTTTATVTGTVTDPSGAAIPGASVAVENTQTHVLSKVDTNSSGFYRVAGLIPGTYRATITKTGFKSSVRDGIELHGQDQISLNYNLQVGAVSESVTVTSSAPLLQSESATVSTVIDSAQIENTPLN